MLMIEDNLSFFKVPRSSACFFGFVTAEFGYRNHHNNEYLRLSFALYRIRGDGLSDVGRFSVPDSIYKGTHYCDRPDFRITDWGTRMVIHHGVEMFPD